MPSQDLLSTKFSVPPVRAERVHRPRLAERLNEAFDRALMLVSAPAGFGKTTLISEWVSDLRSNGRVGEAIDDRIGWLSLDEGDAVPGRFLAYLVAALAQAGALETAAEEEALAMLHSSQPFPTESLLVFLINKLAGMPGRTVLILDDYHLVGDSPAVDVLTFLIDNLPPQVHVIIATRVDPQLSLPRLRAKNQLTEIRAADLRFTPAEATAFLNQVMGLGLSEEAVLALDNRTEGWIAGLQLAALSLRGRRNTSELIHEFTGSHRFVLDYLIEEVLNQQQDEVRSFLFNTAILDRMNASLCNAVTGRDNGQATLEMLDQTNMFVVPLDEERTWYRYHRLFRDLLRQRVYRADPDRQPILNLKASQWYEANGNTEQAIRHSLQAGDADRAATLAEMSWREMHMSYKGVTWLGWVEAIPDHVVRARPWLSTGIAWSLIDSGDLDGAELRLKDAERWVDSGTDEAVGFGRSMGQPGPEAEEDLRSLLGSIANARAYLSQAQGDLSSTVEQASRARELLPEHDAFERSLSAILPGLAYWSKGDLEAACRSISHAISHMRTLGKTPFIISFSSYMADIMVSQGRLNEARKLYLRLLDLTKSIGEPDLPEMAVVHFGLSEVLHEQGDLERARWHLRKGEELGELPAFPPWFRHWIWAQIRVQGSAGRLGEMVQTLDKSQGLYYRHPIPDVRPLSALIARSQLAAGSLDAALRWVRLQGLAPDDDLSYLHEFEHLTLAKVLVAQYRREHVEKVIENAIHLLKRLLEEAELGQRMGSVIEILVVLAVAHEANGDRPQALKSLGQALTLAEPEGYIQTFVVEGAPMSGLLGAFGGDRPELDAYVQILLDAFSEGESRLSDQSSLIEPLSERELEVLKQLAAGCTNRDVAERLFLSINTVKAHTRNIYGKLDVNNRTQAVAQARQLGLLES